MAPINENPVPNAPDSQHADGTVNSASEIVVKCSALTKIFRDFWFRNRVRAVDGLDLEVRRGEVFGLLGPNGSGKSTTIKLILGLLHATSGRVAVFGRRAEDVAVKKLIGYLPEESDLYRFLNARETLDYYGRLFHLDRHQRQRRIEMLLRMVGLDAVQRRPVGEYSKGMKRRIGLAQALINDPQLLILDEPTTGLDPIGTRQIKDLLVRLRERGKTILLCSHLLADVEDVCDRVAIMYGGRLQRQGTVDGLLVEQDATMIRTERLDDETISQIDALLARKGKHIEEVAQPRQKLEALFLDIVHQAQARGSLTSGARGDGQIADFLAGEDRVAHMPESVDAAALIDKLVESAAGVSGGETAEEATEAEPVKPRIDQDIIDDLTGSESAEDSGEVPGGDGAGDPVPPQKRADRRFLETLTAGSGPSDSADQSSDAGDHSKPGSDEVAKHADAAAAPSGPARPEQGESNGERPDPSFIDALSNVPPAEESDDPRSSDSNNRSS